MARRPVLGGGTLNPFASGGVDFGAFNILDPGNEAYLAFVKVETAWNAGKATNDQYLAALEAYAKAQDAGSSNSVSLFARLEAAKYQVARNVLLSRIDNRQATYADLVAFDKGKLNGISHDSEEYGQRLDLYRSSQAKLIAEEEKKQVERYQNGKMTTSQLRAWYQGVLHGSIVDNNPDLVESLKDRITELVGRVQDEKDSQVLSDFSHGKMTTHDFIAYATAAKARYAAGTTQAKDWTDRLSQARQHASENDLLYRYNLSEQYAELQRFVKSNSGGSGGRTSTSHSTRVVLGADGHWHTITTTSTKAVKPSAAEVNAHAKLLIQIADAKKQMAQIASKIIGVGGFVQSKTILSYYQRQLGTFARGSDEWYAVQGKIDNINDRIHQESVYSKEGIKITYPSGGGGSSTGGGSASATSSGHPSVQSGGGGGSTGGGHATNPGQPGGGGYTLAQFMRAIATQESGGRYNARNGQTGAYGKYQILPSNWASWAQKAGLPANAPQTPENQERVATAAFQRLARSYDNDWSRVAAAWFGGVAGERNRGPRTQRYVAAIMSHMGTTVAAVSGRTATASGTYHAAGAGAPAPSAAAPGGGGLVGAAATHITTHNAAHPTASHAATGRGPLATITSVGVAGRRGVTEVVGLHYQGFPTNLDGRAFERFYANYERAFENGDESFVDTSSGHAVAYFVGADPLERLDRMRHLDDLRVSLYDERAIAYQGTASELTAANQRNEAYKDVARHEYLIVDTAAQSKGGSAKLNAATNPLASGIRLLDKTEAAVKANLALAQAAYARGDITAAYSLFQQARAMLDANGQTIHLIAGYAASTKAHVASITAATGGIDPTEALGAEKGGAFQADLDRLSAFNVELKGLFDAKATATLTDIQAHVEQDRNGDVVWDDPNDPNAQLKLTEDSYFLLKPNGSVSLETRPPVPNVVTGQNDYGDDKTVTVRIKVGTHVLQAQAAYTIGQVGAFVDPSDGHLLPIMGKLVQQKVDGKWVTFFENPLNPGSKDGSWSSKAWVFSAPQGFTAVPDGHGGVTYTFTASSRRARNGMALGDGTTYSLVFDPGKGAYMVTANNPGGLFTAAIKDAPIGAAGWSEISDLFSSAGIVRQGGSDGGFDQTLLPVFGMNPDENAKWEHSFQPPAIKALNRVGGLSGGLSPDERDEANQAARTFHPPKDALLAGDPSSIAARAGTAAHFQLPKSAISAGDPSSIAARSGVQRVGLPPIAAPQVGGLSPDERDEISRRAALPKPPDKAFTSASKKATRPVAKAAAPAPKATPLARKARRPAAKTKPVRAPLPAIKPPSSSPYIRRD